MKRAITALGCSLALTGFAAGLTPASATVSTAGTGGDFMGAVSVDGNCSGALVRFASSTDSDKGMILTNGHCHSVPGQDYLKPGQVVVGERAAVSMTFLKSDGKYGAKVKTDQVMYATMTNSDIALYRLPLSFAELKSKHNVVPFTMGQQGPKVGDGVTVISGLFSEQWSCKIAADGLKLREGDWSWTDSVRYGPGCETKHGVSGAPVLNTATRELVAVHNTGNDDGDKSCKVNNPCEVDAQGKTTSTKGRKYAQQAVWFNSCLTADRQIDLKIQGCLLPRR